METIVGIGIGIAIGWLVFHSRKERGQQKVSGPEETRRTAVPSENQPVALLERSRSQDNHTLRKVAGGVAAGALLGHMLSRENRTENQSRIHNVNNYQEYYAADEDSLNEEDDYGVYDARDEYDDEEDEYENREDYDDNDADDDYGWDDDTDDEW